MVAHGKRDHPREYDRRVDLPNYGFEHHQGSRNRMHGREVAEPDSSQRDRREIEELGGWRRVWRGPRPHDECVAGESIDDIERFREEHGEQKIDRDRAISFWWDVVGDEDCMQTEADHQAGKCGFEAWTLATKLRKRYGMPVSGLAAETWDFIGTLKREHDAARAAQEKRKPEAAGERGE